MAITTGGQGLTATGPPSMGSGLTIVRAIILVFALGAAIAGGYLISLFSTPEQQSILYGYSGPGGFIVFDAVFTWIVVGLMFISELWAPRMYIRAAFIGALILNIILWAGAWGWAASSSANFYRTFQNVDYGKNKWLKSFATSMTACAALGGTTWVLLVIFLMFFIRACMAAPSGSSFSK